jgi:hypothetical protein
MTAVRLVAVPDIFLPDGTVRRGAPPLTQKEIREAMTEALVERIRIGLNMGWITRDEARMLLRGRC